MQKMKTPDIGGGNPHKKPKAHTANSDALDAANAGKEFLQQKRQVWVGCYPNCCKDGYWKDE